MHVLLYQVESTQQFREVSSRTDVSGLISLQVCSNKISWIQFIDGGVNLHKMENPF